MKRMERQEFAENAKRRFKLMNRLKEKYLKEVKPKLKEEFGYKNELAVPSLKKVVVNMGIGEAKDNEGITKSFEGLCLNIINPF